MVDGYAVLGGYAEAQRFSKAQHTGIDDPFVIGNIVMKVDGDWILQDLAHYAENMEFVTAPASVPDDRFNKQGEYANEKDQYITWAGGMCMAIPQSARNAEGGWQYIQYMNTLEAFRIECSAQQAYRKSRGGLWSPRLMARIERNELTKREYMPKDEQISNALRMHIDMLSNARIRPASPVAQLMWDQHVRAMEKACLKEVSPTEALATAQAVVQEELNQVYADAKYPVVDMRLPAYLGLVAALIGIGIFYSRYRTANLQPLERHESRWGHILLIPWYIGFLGLTLGPMVMSLFFSFTHYNVLSPARWVGLENYHDLYADQQGLLKTALANVCYLGGVGVPLGLITGLSIALLLNNASRGIGFFRTAFYLPSIMPIVATVIVWLFILNADPTRGLVSSIWSHTIQAWFGKSPPGFITVAEWAKPSVIMMGVWGAGSGLFLWLAGLKAIPNTLYEAANLDGASASRQFFSITIPQLSPLIFYNTIIGVIGALQTFEASYVITGGENAGPNDSLLTPVYHLFRNGFAYFKMGYACALAWLLFVIILLVTLVQWRVLQRFVHTEVRDEK
jgi:multiple sugar transport system permease protein